MTVNRIKLYLTLHNLYRLDVNCLYKPIPLYFQTQILHNRILSQSQLECLSVESTSNHTLVYSLSSLHDKITLDSLTYVRSLALALFHTQHFIHNITNPLTLILCLIPKCVCVVFARVS